MSDSQQLIKSVAEFTKANKTLDEKLKEVEENSQQARKEPKE